MSKVYVRTDDLGRVIAINSDDFLIDLTGWTQVDEGDGDRYHHAQNNYLNGGLATEQGIYRYKFVTDKIVARTEAEMQADIGESPPPVPGLQETIDTLRAQVLSLQRELLGL